MYAQGTKVLLHILSLVSQITAWFSANLNAVSFWLTGALQFNIHQNQQQIKLNQKQASPWANCFTHPPRHALVISPTSCGTVWHVYSCTVTKFFYHAWLIHHYTLSCCIVNNLLYVPVHKNLTKVLFIHVINDFTVHVSQLHFARLCLSSFKQSIQNNQATMLTTVTMSNIFQW